MRIDSKSVSQRSKVVVHARKFARVSHLGGIVVYAMFMLILGRNNAVAVAQSDVTPASSEVTSEQKVEQLTADVQRAQAQIEASQKLLSELQQQLRTLQQELARDKTTLPTKNVPGNSAQHEPSIASGAATVPSKASNDADPGGLAASLDEVRERQAMVESQIATHELTKVETQSKYPVTVTGLVLFNAFVNTRQVDIAAAPAYAISGSGSTGLSLQQTVLGLDARGPHLLGGASRADVRADFFSNGTGTSYASGGVLRLRTAHGDLEWKTTKAFVELDRSIIEPHAPSSLLVVGQPELAWAGNLWTWDPQIGVSHEVALGDSARMEVEAALIDVSDPSLRRAVSTASLVTRAERSRWPGSEARISLRTGATGLGAEVGFGGYFSSHVSADNYRFDAWAGTVDLRLPLTQHFEILANAYRGAALGGLGGGGYVDYVYQYQGSSETTRALDDVGGWAQLKAKAGQRWEWNTGYGLDNPFASEVALSFSPTSEASYPGLVRNRSYFGNVIYSPSKYLLFSLEYRRLWSTYAADGTKSSDVIGIGAGYKF
jgi:hypothetical protein